MNLLTFIGYNDPVRISDYINSEGKKELIYLIKSESQDQQDRFFLKSYIKEEQKLVLQGYLYFYLNNNKKTSSFIGIEVKPEYRNKGIATLLTANWIMLSLENGYEFLQTNRKQGKPFLLYLLKTYGFEINDPKSYIISPATIHICADEARKNKYLLFNDKQNEERFMKCRVAREDNYIAIDRLTPGISYLDSVLLSNIYHLNEVYKAYEKSELVRNRVLK